MDLVRNVPETVRAVIDRIHRRDHRRENLRSADVRGRLLAADVLLARLQSEPVSRLAAGIDRNADDAARKRALIGVLGRDKGGVRTAVAHRHAETLGGSDRDVHAQFPGRSEQGQCKRVARHDSERAGRVQS